MQTEYIITSPDAVVSEDGWINVCPLKGDSSFARDEPVFRLSQKAAIDLALELVQAVRLSQDRSQINHAPYYETAAILRRMESPLGQSEKALRSVFG